MNETGWNEFINLCLAAKDAKTLISVLDLFLTQDEQESLATRYLIVMELLKQEKTQRDMAEDLQVSIAKITRGSNELKRMKKPLIEFLKTHVS